MITWLPIPTAPGYWVSNDGRVRHYDRELAPHARGGYLRVNLVVDGRKTKRAVHLLVLEAFHGPRPSPKHHGAHFPLNDKTCNCESNLAWKLPHENEADKKLCGTVRGGGAKKRADAERVRARAQAGESYLKIAREEGLHPHSVSRIVRGLRRATA